MSVDELVKKYDVVCLGNIMVDIVFSVISDIPKKSEEIYTSKYLADVGGGAAITAVGLKKLGLRATIRSSIGKNDVFGEFILRELQRHEINTDCLLRLANTKTNISAEMSLPSDRATVTASLPEHSIQLDSETEIVISQSKHLHVIGPLLDEHVRIVKFASTLGVKVSVDPNGVLKDLSNILGEMLPYIDILMPNQVEATGWNGLSNLREIAIQLGEQIKENGFCIVKLGEQGAIASNGCSYVEKPAFFSAEVKDTTGAGDAFSAGVIYSFLRDGTIENCLDFGNAMGALKVRKIGGVAGMPNKEEVHALLRKYGINTR